MKQNPIKALIIGLLCASVASVAFSHTNKPTAAKKNEAHPQQSKSADAKSAHLKVVRITNIRVNPTGLPAGSSTPVMHAVGPNGKSTSYPVKKSTTFVDQSGRAIDRNKIPSGANARLEFDSSGAISRVIVEK